MTLTKLAIKNFDNFTSLEQITLERILMFNCVVNQLRDFHTNVNTQKNYQVAELLNNFETNIEKLLRDLENVLEIEAGALATSPTVLHQSNGVGGTVSLPSGVRPGTK